MKQINKKRLFIVSIVLVLIAVSAIIFASKHDSTQINKAPNIDERIAGPAFKLEPTTGLAYKVTRTSTAEDGTQTSSLFEKSNKGTSRGTSKVNGELNAEVYSGETAYSCKLSRCSKLINDNYNPDLQRAYDYDSTTITLIGKTAKYQGSKSCSSGMCDVWSWENDSGLQTTTDTLYINQATEVISQVQRVVTGGATYISVYEFIPIVITIPPTPTEIPNL